MLDLEIRHNNDIKLTIMQSQRPLNKKQPNLKQSNLTKQTILPLNTIWQIMDINSNRRLIIHIHAIEYN